MMLNEIVFMFTVIPFLLFIWVAMFFIFDDSVLKGYFAKLLRKRFNVEEL